MILERYKEKMISDRVINVKLRKENEDFVVEFINGKDFD
jgi:hypothetical protein